MRNKQACFTSLTDNWNTPDSIYEQLDKEFCFDFDPCPKNHNFDGLSIEWGKSNFVNPPYSKWQEWVKKGFEEHKKGKTVVFLLASRTDTKVFHEIILPHAKEIRFIKGRLKFGGSKHSAPFPSMVVILE
jgi:site-specific DNA-methyltransferase (adenine-specific)